MERNRGVDILHRVYRLRLPEAHQLTPAVVFALQEGKVAGDLHIQVPGQLFRLVERLLAKDY